MFEEAARERKQSGLVQNRSTVSANLREPIEGHKAAEDAAKLLNVSARSAESGSRVLEHGAPELVQAVEQGAVKVSTAATLTKLPQAQQKEILDQGQRTDLKPEQLVQNFGEVKTPKDKESTAIAAKAVDMNRETYRQAKAVVDTVNDELSSNGQQSPLHSQD
ncbi:MAG TPA: hypothetical protein VN441_02935 [Syntrophomonas sp.]|nr:hypothetical protein [Syntrophomonas sp.]